MVEFFAIVLSGLVTSLIFMVLSIFRNYYKSEKTLNNSRQLWRQNESSTNWLGILLIGTGIFYGWCLAGAGLHFLLGNGALVIRVSFLALAGSMLIALVETMKTIGKTESLKEYRNRSSERA